MVMRIDKEGFCLFVLSGRTIDKLIMVTFYANAIRIIRIFGNLIDIVTIIDSYLL